MTDKKLTILVIEDEPELLDGISEILHYEGYGVLKADNGIEGVELAEQHSPDLILCDIMMPGLNGYEVLEMLKNRDPSFSIPFIYLTALTERKDIRTGMDLGADDYITKPFTIDELNTTIKSRLSKYLANQLKIESIIRNAEQELNQQFELLSEKINSKDLTIQQLREKAQSLGNRLTERESEIKTEVLKKIEINNTLGSLTKMIEDELSNRDLSNDQKNLLLKILAKLKNKNALANKWTIFQTKFNQSNPLFISQLKKSFPSLTNMDLTLSSAIVENLNTTQVAQILNITNESVRKNKFRLKKKLDLDKDTDLMGFLVDFKLKNC